MPIQFDGDVPNTCVCVQSERALALYTYQFSQRGPENIANHCCLCVRTSNAPALARKRRAYVSEKWSAGNQRSDYRTD